MKILFNGDYKEADITEMPGYSHKTLEKQEKTYSNYAGISVGDFKVLDVEYDWGKHDQRWHVKCTRCGKEQYIYHATDWRRGKGRSTQCDCRKRIKSLQECSIKILNTQKRSSQYDNPEYIGKVYGEWEIIEFAGDGYFLVKCTQCGKHVKRQCYSVINGKTSPCNHIISNDYSTDDWIGKREGHLTVIGRSGKMFIARCDCGREVTVRPTDMFRGKAITTCGSLRCEYHKVRIGDLEGAISRKKGRETEEKAAALFRQFGYTVEVTPQSGDYGVDAIIDWSEGHKMAVQVKRHKNGAGIESVQQVYAGGRFYDCDMFTVINPYGFTPQAKKMAAKLGVYLADKTFDYPEDLQKYCEDLLLSTYSVPKERLSKPSTSKRKTYTIRDFTGTLTQICNHFDVLQQTVSYRMKHRNMTLEEAIFAGKD